MIISYTPTEDYTRRTNALHEEESWRDVLDYERIRQARREIEAERADALRVHGLEAHGLKPYLDAWKEASRERGFSNEALIAYGKPFALQAKPDAYARIKPYLDARDAAHEMREASSRESADAMRALEAEASKEAERSPEAWTKLADAEEAYAHALTIEDAHALLRLRNQKEEALKPLKEALNAREALAEAQALAFEKDLLERAHGIDEDTGEALEIFLEFGSVDEDDFFSSETLQKAKPFIDEAEAYERAREDAEEEAEEAYRHDAKPILDAYERDAGRLESIIASAKEAYDAARAEDDYEIPDRIQEAWTQAEADYRKYRKPHNGIVRKANANLKNALEAEMPDCFAKMKEARLLIGRQARSAKKDNPYETETLAKAQAYESAKAFCALTLEAFALALERQASGDEA